MKPIFTTFVMLILLLTNIKAQYFSHNFGEVTDAEINMKYYEKDKTADAVIIYDIGKTKFVETDDHSGFNISFKRKTRLKIFNKAGFDYAEIVIPYYVEKEKKEEVLNITAYTRNVENGMLTREKLDSRNIFTEKMSENVYVKKFAMPMVKEGSIIEYEYELISPFLFHAPSWEFQHRIPTIYSKYVINTIPFYGYRWILQGAGKLDEPKTYESRRIERYFYLVIYKDIVNEFVLEDIPAFNDETFITCVQDYITKLDFQLSYIKAPNGAVEKVARTWQDLSKFIIKHDDFGKYIKKAERAYKKTVTKHDLLSEPEQERVDFIVRDIKSKYNWNGYYGKYANKKVKGFLTKKTGNSAEINLFLLGALRAAKVEALPVILSTRDHGRIIEDYPFENFFNDVIVYATVNNKTILLDATDSYCSDRMIPPNCINNKGLLVKKRKAAWVTLRQKEISASVQNTEAYISEDLDSLKGTFSIKYTKYDALKNRKKFQNEISEIEKYFTDAGLEISGEAETKNYTDIEKPYEIKFEASTETERIGDMIFVSPFFGQAISENPLKQKTRTYPIDKPYLQMKMFRTVITVPENCKLEKLPTGFFVSNNLVSADYKAKKLSDSKIEIKASYSFKKSVYEASEYARIKKFYDDIVEKMNQKIVFTEK